MPRNKILKLSHPDGGTLSFLAGDCGWSLRGKLRVLSRSRKDRQVK